MKNFIYRLIVSALSLGLAASIVPGIRIDNFLTLVLAAFLMGIINAVVRPIFVVLTLPLTVLTLGLFLFVINAAMLGLVAFLLPGFSINGFWAALGGWLIVSISSWIASKVFASDKSRGRHS